MSAAAPVGARDFDIIIRLAEAGDDERTPAGRVELLELISTVASAMARRQAAAPQRPQLHLISGGAA